MVLKRQIKAKLKALLRNVKWPSPPYMALLAPGLCGLCIVTALWLVARPATTAPQHTMTAATALPPNQQLPEPIHWSTVTLKHGDNLSKLFKRHHIPQQTLMHLTQNKNFQRHTRHLQIGQLVHVGLNPQQQLIKLRIPIDIDKDLVAERQANLSFAVHIHQTQMERQYAYAKLTIEDSLHRAAQQKKLDINITQQLAAIYGDRLNMQRDLRKGDQFEVLYEQYLIDGKVAKTGNIVAAKCQHKHHNIDAVRYTTAKHVHGYYDLSGKNLQKSFMRFPCQFKRVSSPFNLNRLHPILRIRRPHYGVDLAASYGTPVHVVADGVVTSVGYRGGYGRTIKVQHGHGRITIYAHLSRYTKRLKKGQKVRKGKVIGYVGSTGYATGPHLHFEIRVNNKPINPLTASLPLATPLSDTEMAQYLPAAQHWLDLLNQQQLHADQNNPSNITQKPTTQ
jgi:murein DD-endopeptidase MepM/ murein hydrolase activator NlpD